MESALPVLVVNPASAHGMLSPIEAVVNDGGIVGRWYIETSAAILARNIANPVGHFAVSGMDYGGALSRSSGALPNPLPVVDGRFGPYLTLRTSIVINNTFAVTWNIGQFIPKSQNPVYIAFIKTAADITSQTLWFTLGDGAGGTGFAAVPLTDPGAAGTSFVGFRFSTGTDAGWVGFCRSGATNLMSLTGVLSTVVASTEYILKLRQLPSGIWAFSVNGSPEQQVSTNLPTGNAYMPLMGVVTKVAATREVLFNADLTYLVPSV